MLRVSKKIFREASRVVGEMIHAMPFSADSRPLTMCSLARAVARQDAALARTLLVRSSLAQKHISLPHGRVELNAPPGFEAKYVE
eukprot:9360217-Alexandrium_andersonii.AAC.1